MKNLKLVGQWTLSAPLVFVLGCAVETANEQDLLTLEDVQSTEQAAGQSSPISSWNDLVNMGSTGTYHLTQDIEAQGKVWTPKDFSGTLDGRKKKIKNLTINSSNAAFFAYLSGATVKDLRFTNLKATGSWVAGGLAASSVDSQIEGVAVEGTVGGWYSAGGLISHMQGGRVTRSYFKGKIQTANYYAGGLVAVASKGTGEAQAGLATIERSYAQGVTEGNRLVLVAPDTSDSNRTVIAGGIAGLASAVDIHDVYAVGDVTGRNVVGGLVGQLTCNGPDWLLYKGIYRGGDVVDKGKNGWAGTVGAWANCKARFTHLSWDSSLDPSPNYLNDPASLYAQRPGTTSEHKTPTLPYEGFFCVYPAYCPNDNNFDTAYWDAGSQSQHHILKNMPDLNAQLR